MASPAQITANRVNAQFASGPKTAEGKSASSRNATRHGLSAATFHVLLHEDQTEFDQLTAGLKAEHQPATLYESFLVEQLSRTWWLLSRAQRLEAKAFDYMAGSALDPTDPDAIVVTRLFELNPNTLQTFQRHADKAEKSFYRARRELKSAQENRSAAATPDAAPAKQEPLPEIDRNEPNSPPPPLEFAGAPLVCVATSYSDTPNLGYNSGITDPELCNRTTVAGRK
jgi:hypothetical protein